MMYMSTRLILIRHFLQYSLNQSQKQKLNIIVDLKKCNSYRINNISSNKLISVVHHIVHPLTYLVNWSLSESVFPEALKVAKVTSLHKKRDTSSIDNYRPISLLSSVSKILEHIVYNIIVSFCNAYAILSNQQHGFRGGRSTQTAILDFLNELYYKLDKNKNKKFWCFYGFE